jgi:hypothetical protein
MDRFFVVGANNQGPYMKTYLVILFLSLHFVCLAWTEPALTAVFDSRKNNVSIKWQHTDETVVQYVVQRSADNFSWSDIHKENAGDIKKNKMVKFTDPTPATGKGYYRLKVYHSPTQFDYTKSIMIIIGNPGNNWLMYPVPVKTMLNLQYNGSELIPGVISVFIQTMKGQVITRLRLASTTRLIQIPVDNLGKGVYDIRIVIQNAVVWNQRFVK